MTELNNPNDKTPTEPQRLVICVGDIHGYLTKLQNLWSNLESHIDPHRFSTALIIFLGDYCDRGPNTKEVVNFLINLPSKYPNQTHVFLAGNHEFAFAAFLGLVPENGDVSFKEGWEQYKENEEREGWYRGEGYESMHLQGRMWGGAVKDKFDVHGIEFLGSVYDAAPTFESYGVPHASSDLRKAVPDDHKKFLTDLVWVHEEDDVCIDSEQGILHCKLIAVHAGLENTKDVDEQLKRLKAKDAGAPKIEAFSGRRNVWGMPKQLTEKQTIVVSGHHGRLHIDGLRLIIDEVGGNEHAPLAAIVLPTVKIIRDTDNLTK